MTTQLIELRDRLTIEFEEINERRKVAIRKLRAVEITIDLLSQEIRDDSSPSTGLSTPSADDEPSHGNLRPDDLQDCRSADEALIKMAQDNDHIVQIIPAAKMLVAAGLSKAQPKNLVANTTTKLNQSDQWEHAGTGIFRYLVDPEITTN